MLHFSLRLLLILVCTYFTIAPSWALSSRFRCIWREDPATSMVIGWDQVSGFDPMVYYDTKDHGLNADAYRYARRPEVVNRAKGMNNNFIRLTGLKSNTVYYFIIKDSEGCSKRFSFRTAPSNPDSRISIIAGGDSRNNREARKNANVMVSKLRPTCVMFAGDMTGGDSPKEWIEWFDDWQATFGIDGRIHPIIVARGNHEASNAPLVQLFDVPHENVYYAMTLGGGLLRLYTLNSLIPSGGQQKKWLSNDLALSQNVTWRFAQYHHAIRPHTKGKGEKDLLLLNWATLFHKYKVQLAIESDAHVVKWTYPIRPSAKPGSQQGFIRDDVNGTVYVGEGCWGAPLRAANDDKVWTRNSGSFNQFKWIFVDKYSIEIRTVQTDGSAQMPSLTDENQFYVHPAFKIWRPSNGEVIRIINPDEVPPEPELPPEPEEEILVARDADEKSMNVNKWVNFPKIFSDFKGKITIDYSIPKSGKVELILINRRLRELSRVVLERQTIGDYSKTIDISQLRRGNYLLVIKANGKPVKRYRVQRR